MLRVFALAGCMAMTGCISSENAKSRQMTDQELFAKVSTISTAKLCDQVIDVNMFRDERTNKAIEDVLRSRGEYQACLDQRNRLALAKTQSQITVRQTPRTCIKTGYNMVSCF